MDIAASRSGRTTPGSLRISFCLLTFIQAVVVSCAAAVPLSAAPDWTETDYAGVTLATFREEPRFLEQIDFDHIDYPRLNAAIFYATNEIRVTHNLSELSYAPQLERSAFGHARRMVEKKFFSHTDNTDRRRVNPNARGKLAGIANPYLAENIANTFAITYRAGRNVYPRRETPGAFSYTPTGPLIPPHTYLSFADAVLDNWMHSSGHRANILSTKALQLGCGAYFYRDPGFHQMARFKAVQNFQWFKTIVPGPAED